MLVNSFVHSSKVDKLNCICSTCLWTTKSMLRWLSTMSNSRVRTIVTWLLMPGTINDRWQVLCKTQYKLLALEKCIQPIGPLIQPTT